MADPVDTRGVDSTPLPPPRKKRKRKKKADPAPQPEAKTGSVWAKLRGRVWILLLAAGIFEVWMFGRRGHVEVCVAREGVHDFALLGTERNDENTRRFPTCEKRLNIGITSHYDKAVEEAMLNACRRANILLGKDAILLCAIKEGGWQHRVTDEQCPPWHDHYYKRLFWFLQTE